MDTHGRRRAWILGILTILAYVSLYQLVLPRRDVVSASQKEVICVMPPTNPPVPPVPPTTKLPTPALPKYTMGAMSMLDIKMGDNAEDDLLPIDHQRNSTTPAMPRAFTLASEDAPRDQVFEMMMGN